MAAQGREGVRVGVLAGGSSDEREISLSSGANAARALCEAGYGSVELMDPADGDFLVKLAASGIDVAFLALHGRGGEDGMIQSILGYLGIPYTGSDVAASAAAADKDLSKLLYARAGIPVAPWATVRRGEEVDIAALERAVGPESFVKPALNGSSYGITHVMDPADLPAAVALALEHSEKALVERRVRGTEVTVGVIGDGATLRALPIVEICMPDSADFYDLAVKYVDPTDIHRIPARLDEDVYADVQELACRAHRALGCFGISRSDFIVSDEGPVILETNTLPGMTETSLFPDEVRHTGGTFAEACAELVDLALARGAVR